jgi:uncharacterized membrane protein
LLGFASFFALFFAISFAFQKRSRYRKNYDLWLVGQWTALSRD